MKHAISNRKATALLIAGILAMMTGFYRGEVATVLEKAIVICLECVGIG
jgi:hypothetical protein